MYKFRGVRQSGNCINEDCAELRNINNQNIEPAFEAEFLILSAADIGIAILCLNCLGKRFSTNVQGKKNSGSKSDYLRQISDSRDYSHSLIFLPSCFLQHSS